jgi:hypothetical protein
LSFFLFVVACAVALTQPITFLRAESGASLFPVRPGFPDNRSRLACRQAGFFTNAKVNNPDSNLDSIFNALLKLPENYLGPKKMTPVQQPKLHRGVIIIDHANQNNKYSD